MSKWVSKVKAGGWQHVVLYLICVMLATTAAADTTTATTSPADTIRIREIMPINFGRFTIERGVGSVEVDARSGACQPRNAVMIRALCERGQFEITGAPGSRVLLQVVGGSTHGSATINNLNIHPADGIVTIGANGLAYAYIGGRITVGQQKRRADLQANYHIEANYLP